MIQKFYDSPEPMKYPKNMSVQLKVKKELDELLYEPLDKNFNK